VISDSDEVCVDLVEPCIDVTKNVDPQIASVGDDVTYTICVTNCGDIALENVVVNDPMLGGDLIEFSDYLPVGGSECNDYIYTIPEGSPIPLINCVTVNSDPEGYLINDITDEDCAEVYMPCIDVDKKVWNSKTSSWVNDIIIEVGTLLNFNITITNCGPISLTNVHVLDTMSLHLEYCNNSNYPEYSVSTDLREIIWVIDEILPGEIIYITFDAKSVIECQGWNHVIVTTEQQLSDEAIVIVKNIKPEYSISIDKQIWNGRQWVDEAVLIGNRVLYYKITVVNNGIYDLEDVIVTDDLPNFMMFVHSDFIPSIVDGTHIEWDVGFLRFGGSVQFIYTVYSLPGNEGCNNAYTEGNTNTGIVSDLDSVYIIC
jgi:uncharacterized repeat protein (TIGR01451 family)